MSATVRYQVGVDTGGTFTDFVAIDAGSGDIVELKVPSVPDDPASAVATGLNRLANEHGIVLADIERFVFGTTVATNAVLELDGALTALVATRGTRDVLEIQRSWRPRLFDLYLQARPPLVARRDRFEVDERIGAGGEVITPLVETEAERIAELVADNYQAVAVCLLFSFLSPEHERRLREAIQARVPYLHVSLSSDVCPEFREYERSTTTAMNAYVAPKIDHLIEHLERGLAAHGIHAPLGIMQSNGGIMQAHTARRLPVNTLLSGPAGGVVGALEAARSAGLAHVIAMDMGGTSLDVCLGRGATLELNSEGSLGGYPVKVPQIDVHTIGAGGGSIARVEGGLLKVGPRSAGAVPGPACYRKGGRLATSTDAAAVLGYLVAERFAGGDLVLDVDAARSAVAENIGTPLGMNTAQAAWSIVRVQVAEIVAGIRSVSVERGHDPRGFVLLAFGGAGALYAGLVAAELGMRKVLVPASPGVLSALGMLLTDLKHTAVATRLVDAAHVTRESIDTTFAGLSAPLVERLRGEGVSDRDVVIELSCDMRYRGQAYEVNVVVEPGKAKGSDDYNLSARFHQAHAQRYGRASEGEPVEIVNFRVTATGQLSRAAHRRTGSPQVSSRGPLDSQPVYFDDTGKALQCPIYDRQTLGVGECFQGPALVVEAGASTVVYPGYQFSMDEHGHLLMTATN